MAYGGVEVGRAFVRAGMQWMPAEMRVAFERAAGLQDLNDVACQPRLLSQWCANNGFYYNCVEDHNANKEGY